MANLNKLLSERDAGQAIRGAFNEVDHSTTVAGFLVGKTGNKITKTNVDSVTEDYSYYDAAILLYTLRIIYTDASKSDFASAERTI